MWTTPIVYILKQRFWRECKQEAAPYAPIIAGLLGCGVKKLEETAAAWQRPEEYFALM